MTRIVPFSRGLAATGALALCISLAICCLLAAGAEADDSAQYPSDPASRTFNGGPAGWTSSSINDGLCIPPVLCASVTNAYVAGGDGDSSGYISSDYLGVAGVGAIAGTTTGVWESPTFTYSGTGKELTFSMMRRADVDALLAVAGNSADYAVRLINVSQGDTVQTLVAPQTLAGANGWSAIPPVSVKAGRLVPGDQYRIRIESIYKTGTGVLVTGSADYDNVVLGPDAGGGSGDGGGNGKGKGKGNGNGNGSDSSSRELRSMFGSAQSGTAILSGSGATAAARAKRLLVKVNCPRKIGRTCRVTAQGMLSKRKPATKKKTVKVRSGKSKRVVLIVKPKLRPKVAKRKRLLVKQKVRAGKTTATVYKVRKLIRR